MELGGQQGGQDVARVHDVVARGGADFGCSGSNAGALPCPSQGSSDARVRHAYIREGNLGCGPPGRWNRMLRSHLGHAPAILSYIWDLVQIDDNG